MKLDLHLHTKYSLDSRLELEDILNVAKSKLDGVAVTDHNTIKGGREMQKMAERDFEVIVGAEIRTDMGEVIGYFLSEEISSRNFWEVCDEIKAQGGIVAVPHPFDFLRPHTLKPTKEILKVIDAVEVFNSRCAFGAFNEKAMKFALENKLNMTAGSDAHTTAEIGSAGVVVNSPEDIRHGNVQLFGEKTSPLKILIAKASRII